MNNKNTADVSTFEVGETAPFDSQALHNLKDLRRYESLSDTALWEEGTSCRTKFSSTFKLDGDI
jgi:hypothetical protein